MNSDATSPPGKPVADRDDATPRQRARPRKHSFAIAGHRTSISLEAEFWDALRDIAATEHRSLASLVADIDRTRGESGLSGAIRVHVLEHLQARLRAQDAGN